MNKITFFLSQFNNPRINKAALLNEVFSKLSFDELLLFEKRIPSLFKSLIKAPYLRRKSFSELFGIGKFLLDDFVDIYGSLTFIILKNAREINKYLDYKEKLDCYTAVGKYDEAYSLLDSIETEVSASMTGTYYRLRLIRLDKGFNSSAQFHNEICKENTLLSYLSTVVFRSSSIDLPFENDIEGRYHALLGGDAIKDFFTAFAFPFKRIKGEEWLSFLLYTSIIDLYEGFVLQLINLANDRLKDESIKGYVSIISRAINDNRLHHLDSLLNPDEHNNETSSYSHERDIIERYYSGDYTYVFSKGKEYLIEHPLESTIMDLFYKSCVKLNLEPNILFPETTLAGRVHALFFATIACADYSVLAHSHLRSVCIAWFTMTGLRQIYHQLVEFDLPKGKGVYHDYWRYSLLPEIRDFSFFDSSSEVIAYLESCGYNPGDCTQISILKGEVKDEYNQSLTLLKGFSDDQIPCLVNSVRNNSPTPLLLGILVSLLFERQLDSKHYSDAILLYVHTRLAHPHILIYLNLPKISTVLNDFEDKGIREQQDLAVFYTMINADVYKRYLAYKRYLKASGYKRASEIDDLSALETRFFLGKVVDRAVLTLHATEFETEEEIVLERIEICKKLFAATNDKSFSDEIATLIKEQEVKALAQQVNDSKIHVDVQSLINEELATERISFGALSEVDDQLETLDQRYVEKVLDSIIQTQNKSKPQYDKEALPAVNYKRILFRQLVLNIRDKFLFDPKYGLDKYLSSRIRHGTLITQLRNHFLFYSLVTNKQEGGEYIRINPWSQHRYAHLAEAEKESINCRLLQFTEWLDMQLFMIKEERIQIKTERADGKKEGLFDYSEELIGGMIDELGKTEFESFDAFVHATISLLWRWTSRVLQNVCLFFQDFQEVVLKELSRLNKEIVPMMSNSIKLANNFKDAITSCSTEFQLDITVVSSWFKPEQSTVRFFTIQQAVDTSLAVINKINQGSLKFMEISIKDSERYSGEYFNSFHDIFHDMMNNVLGYEAKRPSMKGKGVIYIENQNNQLFIEVTNPIDRKDVEGLTRIVQEQKNIPSWISGGSIRKEGNSGCMKIYSTVMYSLGTSNLYENTIQNNRFIARIRIDTKQLVYHEDSFS